MQFITNSFGDESLYEVNRNTFNRLGASALYAQQYGQSLRREDTLYVVVGTDSGLLPRWLLKEDLAAGSRYIFVELPSLIDSVRAQLPELANIERVTLVTPDEWTALAQEFRFQDYAYIDRMKVEHSIGALDAYVGEYHALRHAVDQEVERFNRGIQLSMGNQAFMRRQIENLAENLVTAKHLLNSCAGQTAVLIGGGPSLDELLPWIKANRDRLTVIAVSRVARQLLAADLQPDIVASVDPHAISFDVSKEMLRFNDDCLLVNAFHITPLLLAQWPGRAVYRGKHYPWHSKLNEDNLATVGPTVANTALATAVEMGFSQLILAGVDLCFSREGYTHASGSNERKAGTSLGNVGLQVETNGGWRADTTHAFRDAVVSMGAQAEQAKTQGCRIINPAITAAKIPGVDYQPLQDIELPTQAPRLAETLDERLPAVDRSFRDKALKEIGAELARVNGRLRTIIQLSEDALDCNRRLFGRDGKQADFKFKKRMDKIERRLDRDFKDLTPLIKNFGAKLFLRLSRPDRDREWTDEDLERFGDAYYTAYRDSAKSLLDLIEAAQTRTRSRTEELAEHPDFDLLVEQWQADATPGRGRLLARLRPVDDGQLDPQDREQLARLDGEFETLLNEQDTRQARQAGKLHALGLDPVRSKLRVLFDMQDGEELSRLAEQLAGMPEAEAAELHALAQGYLAEINNDPGAALGHYNSILDRAADKLSADGEAPQNPRLEDALRRMSFITLTSHDEQNALMVMDVLSAISPAYEPQYADLLRMTGNTVEAINIYTDYMEKVPHDLGTLLKLGKLYQDIGQAESAGWVYRHILEKDPGNSGASQLLDSLGEQVTS